MSSQYNSNEHTEWEYWMYWCKPGLYCRTEHIKACSFSTQNHLKHKQLIFFFIFITNSGTSNIQVSDKLRESCRNTQGATLHCLTGREMTDVACSLRGSKQAHDNRFNQQQQTEITIQPQFNLHAPDFTELSKYWLTFNTPVPAQLMPSSIDTANALVLLSHIDSSQLY